MYKLILGAVLSLGVSTIALAEGRFIQKIPSGWRLEQYSVNAGDGLFIRFTDSPCDFGSIGTSNLTDKTKNRLWATVLTAKTAKRPMFLYYNYEIIQGAKSCELVSFGTDD